MRKKLLSTFLAICFVLTLLPMTVAAVGAPPAISSIVATNAGSSIGLGTGDKVTITFDQNTNKPTITAATINSNLKLNNGHSWGTNLADGDIEWNADGNILTITFSSVINSTIAVEDTITLDVAANLKDSGGTTLASTATGSITGSFGRTLEIDGSVGLNAAIADAHDGDTIKFTDSGTTALTANININKSITLDLNDQTINFTSTSYQVTISASVTIQGPGTITMNRFISVSSGSTLTVQGDAVIEGTGTWQPLINSGTVSMTGGALKQTGTGYVLQNGGAGVATFNNATIEGQPSDSALIWNANSSTLTLNNCTTRNNFSGTMSGTLPSVIYVTHSAEVTLNGGYVTAPAVSTLPAIEAKSGTTFTNNGATITNGYIKNLGDLSVSVSSGTDQVTLASQTPEMGVTYYYKTTATDDTAAKPASYESDAFDSADWTTFSAATDIPTTGTATVYVQVVKVGDSEQKIYGWGQGSAAPTAGSYAITASATANGSYTVQVGGSAATTAQAGETVTITPTAAGGYELDAVSVCKTVDTSTTVTVTGSTFTMPAYAVTVSVTFRMVSPPPSGGGVNIPPAPVTEIPNGGSTTGANLGQLVSENKPLTVSDDNGAKLVFDTDALKGISGQTSGNIKVEMKDVSPVHQESLPGRQVFSLTVSSGGSTITNFGGAVTVTLPYALKEGETADAVTVWYLASDGTMTEIPCTYDPATGLATFKVTHFSLYVVGVDAPWVNPFSDVSESDWYYGAVEYANRNGLFAGTGTDLFSPNSAMTRAMLWTVLGRLDGQSLSGSGIYEAARSWAIGTGITDGSNPDCSITREQMVTILWRYAGAPTSDGELSGFSDAGSVSDYAEDAMVWAVKKGIVEGENDALMPQHSAARAQVATILQRFIEATAK